MKILFVAPRYHTNQIPVTNGLVNDGHEVLFMVQAIGKTEDYSVLTPERVKLSLLGKIVSAYYKRKLDNVSYEHIMTYKTIPSFFYFRKRFKEISPDLIILRDRNISTIIAYFACKVLGIKNVILYNQSSLYSDKKKKDGILKRIVFALCPKIRVTVSYINDINDLKYRKEDLYIKEHEYFMPYVAPLNPGTETREYLKGGVINFISMGKYREYKNHYVFLRALKILKERNKTDMFRFTLLGQAKDSEEEEYYKGIEKYVKENGLEDILTLKKNLPYSDMKNIYQENDVFLLSSYAELASISVIEAMSNGVVPISSSHNGTACYISEGKNGFIFETNNENSLADTMMYIAEHRDMIPVWGMNGYNYMKNNCRYENYKAALNTALEKELGIKI